LFCSPTLLFITLITRENQSDGINGNIRDLIRLYNKKHI